MEELKVSPIGLKQIVDDGIKVGEGYYGIVFTYQDRLIKLDKVLYNLLKNHTSGECYEIVNYRYLGGREDFNNPEQIEKLSNMQSRVKLTRLPLGIVTLKDVDYKNMNLCSGIIIPYLKEYLMLECLPKNDLAKVLKVLKNLLLEVRELDDNGIYQKDMYHLDGKGGTGYNIMYKGINPQIVDMSGEDVTIDGNKVDRMTMYIELGNVIIDFLEFNGIIPPYNRFYTDDYDKNKELIKKLEMSIR